MKTKIKNLNIICPFCSSNKIIFIRKIVSEINNKNYDHYNCKNCYLEFFTPLLFEKNIYSGEGVHGYDTFHKGRIDFPIWTLELVNFFKNISFKNKEILEIGSGDSINFDALKKNFKISKNQYSVVELDEKSIKICKKKGLKNIYNFYFDKNFIKKVKKKYDFIIFTEVLEHQVSPNEFLETAFKLLKKDGLLILTVPNKDRFFIKFKEFPDDFPPHHFLRFNKSFFRNNFKSNLLILKDYSMGFGDLKKSSKIISKKFLNLIFFWPLFIPIVILLRILGKIRGDGLIVVLKK